ncbi:unnamed protein product [Prunus brigantina]
MLKRPLPVAVFNMSSLTTLALRGNNINQFHQLKGISLANSSRLRFIHMTQILLEIACFVKLKEYWLNPTTKDLTETRKLWKKQWKVHGKYSDLLAKDYFNLPFKFYGDVNVTRMFEDAGSFSWDGF